MMKRGKYGNPCIRCRGLKVKCEENRTPCSRCAKACKPCERINKRKGVKILADVRVQSTYGQGLEGTYNAIAGPAGSNSTSENVTVDGDDDDEEEEDEDSVVEDDGDAGASGEWEVEKVYASAQNDLYVEDDELLHYGLTAVFRLLSLSHSSSTLLHRVHRNRHQHRHQHPHYPHPHTRQPNPSPPKSHILILTPQDTHLARSQCTCYSHCWSRYLPPYTSVPLTRTEHDHLLSLLFTLFSSWCLRLIPSLFLSSMHTILHSPTSSPLPRSAHYSPFLHNAMLAVACAFSDVEGVGRGMGGKVFAERARGYVEGECERPSLSAVQGLAMLASYYSGMGQQTIGFMYFGMSTRLGQALGLGSDHTQWIKAGFVTTQDIFDRRWCYQMTCAQDACWSLYVGRDFATSLQSADKDLLAHPFSQALDNELFQHPSTSSHSSRSSSTAGGDGRGGKGPQRETERETGRDVVVGQPGYIMTTFVASCELMMISRRVMGIMNVLSRPNGRAEALVLLHQIDAELTSFKLSLPAPLELTPSNEQTATPHKLMLHIAWWWLVILLHRPFCGSGMKENLNLDGGSRVGVGVVSSFDRCTMAADEIMRLVMIWRDNYTLRVTPITFSQAMFCAGTVYLLNSHSVQRPHAHPPSEQTQARDQEKEQEQAKAKGKAKAKARENVKVLIGLLREAAESWGCARKMAEIFESLVRERERERDGAESSRGGAAGVGKGKGKMKSRRTGMGTRAGAGAGGDVGHTGHVRDLQGNGIAAGNLSVQTPMMGGFDVDVDAQTQTQTQTLAADGYTPNATFHLSPAHPHPMPHIASITPDPFTFPPPPTFTPTPTTTTTTAPSTFDVPMDISSEPSWPLPLDPSLLDLFPWYSNIGLGMLDGDTLSSEPNLLDPQAAEMLLSSQMGYFNQGMY